MIHDKTILSRKQRSFQLIKEFNNGKHVNAKNFVSAGFYYSAILTSNNTIMDASNYIVPIVIFQYFDNHNDFAAQIYDCVT